MFANYFCWLLRETDQFQVISRSQSEVMRSLAVSHSIASAFSPVDWQFPGRIHGVMYRGYKKIQLHTKTITLINWITLSSISFDFSGIKWTECWITTWQVSDKFYKHSGCVCDSLSQTKMSNQWWKYNARRTHTQEKLRKTRENAPAESFFFFNQKKSWIPRSSFTL